MSNRTFFGGLGAEEGGDFVRWEESERLVS